MRGKGLMLGTAPAGTLYLGGIGPRGNDIIRGGCGTSGRGPKNN